MRAKKLFKYQALSMLFSTVFFVFSPSAFADSAAIIINEIQISGGTGKTTQDYIELYNKSDAPIDITGWNLRKKTKTATGNGDSVKVLSADSIIPARGYYLWANSSIATEIKADASTSATIAADNSIALLDDKGKIIDQVAWGIGHTDPFIEISAVDVSGFVKDMPEIIERKNFQDTGNNKDDFEIISNGSPTPSGCVKNPEKCVIEDEDEETKIYSNKIQITELFPDPDEAESENEYIEFFNSSDKAVDITEWKIEDIRKGSFTLTVLYCAGRKDACIILPKNYFAIYNKDYEKSGMFLRKTVPERIILKNPSDEEVSNAAYDKSKANVSYNFNGNDWHWSSFLTPGKENIFEKIPAGELSVYDDIYVNVYADFEILGLSKNAKVDWDFGDGHGSTLQKTRHKYLETGKYSGSVKYSEGSDDVIKNFTVDVGEVPHPDVKIVSINANPVGNDTGFESMTILNDSKKKINLNGWSIATGWKKLSNHPISQDFEIKAGKEKEITHEFSKFTLNNTKSKIELRYPDGEVAYDVKYKSEKGVDEGALYVKGKKGWSWVQQEKKNSHQSSVISNQIKNINPEPVINNPEPVATYKIMEDQIGMQTKVERLNQLAANRISPVKIELLSSNSAPRVLGAETVREEGGTYHFTPRRPTPEHYAIVFFKNIFAMINAKINTLINLFS